MSTNNLTITPTLSSINVQRMPATQNNIVSTPAAQTPIQPQSAAENSNSNEPAQKTKNNTKKIIITAGVALAALAGIYALVKSGKNKEKAQEVIQNAATEIAQNNKVTEAATETLAGKTGEAAVDKAAEVVDSTLDKLDYEIKPPKISDLVNDSDFMEHVDDEFPLELQYNKVLYDIRRDKNTLKRYNEVEQILKDASNEITNKFQAVDGDINSAVDKMDGLDKYTEEYLRNSGKSFSICAERAISQKRYFSIPGNQQEGYCCKDPLLSKEARAEIIDTYLGYNLLSPLRGSLGVKENPLLNALRNKYTISNDTDNKFINECISKMTSNPESSASGQNSSFHAYELAHLGKIFREAMGVTVK